MEPSLNISWATQCERLGASTTMASSTNTVDVFLGQQWNVIVDDATSSRHVQAARCNIGGHHYVCVTGGERGKRLGSLPLTAITMDQYGFDGMAAQR
jgi:hypothetical protein